MPRMSIFPWRVNAVDFGADKATLLAQSDSRGRKLSA